MCLMHNLTNAFVLYYIFTQNDEIGTNYNNIYKINLSYEFQIMLIIMCILNCFALMFLFNLIIFGSFLLVSSFLYELTFHDQEDRNALF